MPNRQDQIQLELLVDESTEAYCRVTPEALALAVRRLYDEFRAESRQRGMTLEDSEIRESCWAPLAARLFALVGGERGDPAFAEPALSFLVTAAFPRPAAGERFTVRVDTGGLVAVERRPRRLMARNRVRLGNHREVMNRPAPVMAGER